jgi:hypothetical protein
VNKILSKQKVNWINEKKITQGLGKKIIVISKVIVQIRLNQSHYLGHFPIYQEANGVFRSEKVHVQTT